MNKNLKLEACGLTRRANSSKLVSSRTYHF